jgi:hypothetical protein
MIKKIAALAAIFFVKTGIGYPKAGSVFQEFKFISGCAF